MSKRRVKPLRDASGRFISKSTKGKSNAIKRERKNTGKSRGSKAKSKVPKGKSKVSPKNYVQKTPKKTVKKTSRKSPGVGKRGSKKPSGKAKGAVKSARRSIRKGTPRKTDRKSSKASLTRKLDRADVFKVERGKTPRKGYEILSFEMTGEPTIEKVQAIIDRFNLEGKVSLQCIIESHDSDNPEESNEYSTVTFPIYLDTFNPVTGDTKWSGVETDTPMAEAILDEINGLLEAYRQTLDSILFMGVWK